jgi:hypothetical protein
MTDQLIYNLVTYEAESTRNKSFSWLPDEHRKNLAKVTKMFPSNFETPAFTLARVKKSQLTLKWGSVSSSSGTQHRRSDQPVLVVRGENSTERNAIPALVHMYDRNVDMSIAIRKGLQCFENQKYGDNGSEKRSYKGPPRIFKS